jgi:uncharacterized membrane protein YhaH (DUF805 family)
MELSLFTSFEGRIGRQNWWLGLLALVVIEWIVIFVLAKIFGIALVPAMDPNNPEAMGAMGAGAGALLGIVGLIFLWPALALYAKRWHDRDKSGWWTLIALVPIIGGIWLLVELGFLKGTSGSNRFGSDPVAS